jgi:hypothetical protein
MRQRNDTGHVVDVAAYPTDEHPEQRPFTVGPHEDVDFPELLAGFVEVVSGAPVEEQSESDAEPAAKTTRKRAVAAPSTEGVDQ